MEETIRLFDTDSHLIQFETCVLSCEQDGDLYKVTLIETAFFPEEGGQTCDQGTIQDIPVVKVLEENRIIYHWLTEPLWEGDTVTGIVDWQKRFSDMQQHSGEHIVSGLIHDRFGYNNVGFHLGSEFVTMDFDGVLTNEQLRQIEQAANKAVAANIPVQVLFPSDEELAELPYRSKKELEGPIRIVKIPGYDICACCAPHVLRTGEIGMIKLVQMEKHRGGVRIYMLCGFRALADYNEKEDQVKKVSALLSAKPSEIAQAVSRQKEEKAQLMQEIMQLKLSVLKEKVEALPSEQKAISFFSEHMDRSNMRLVWNMLAARGCELCGCFIGDDETGYQYVMGGAMEDARLAGKAFNQALSGKGGGSKEMVQGTVRAGRQAIEQFFAEWTL